MKPSNFSVLSFYAEIMVGYSQRAVTILESDGVAKLTVAITIPPTRVSIETSFLLLVNTSDGTTGLPWNGVGIQPYTCSYFIGVWHCQSIACLSQLKSNFYLPE